MPHIKGFRRFLIRTPYEGTPRGACRVKSETRMRKRTEIRTEPGHDDRQAAAAGAALREHERGRAPRRTASRSSAVAKREKRDRPFSPKSPTDAPKIQVYIDAYRTLTLFAVDRMGVRESANAPYPYFLYVFISGGKKRLKVREEDPKKHDGKGVGRRRARGNDWKPTAETHIKARHEQNR